MKAYYPNKCYIDFVGNNGSSIDVKDTPSFEYIVNKLNRERIERNERYKEARCHE